MFPNVSVFRVYRTISLSRSFDRSCTRLRNRIYNDSLSVISVILELAIVLVFVFIFKNQTAFLFWTLREKAFKLIQVAILYALSMLQIVFEGPFISDISFYVNSLSVGFTIL